MTSVKSLAYNYVDVPACFCEVGINSLIHYSFGVHFHVCRSEWHNTLKLDRIRAVSERVWLRPRWPSLSCNIK